ncbi:hypothetical protein V6246_03200 [Algibacter sp. TI.3.09]|uniref:hypothetical protein n=1 Tax=Algibacter sp. TI.3.09 TaxID=3121298 RepID=UPI00311E97E6
MPKIHLHFLQNLDNDSYKFWQIVTLDEQPKLNSIFNYTQEMFDNIPSEELDRFKKFSFGIGNYYVKTIIDYTDKAGEIDYIIELVYNLN